MRVGWAFARFDVIGFHRYPQATLVLDDIALADFVAVDFHEGANFFVWRRNLAPMGPLRAILSRVAGRDAMNESRWQDRPERTFERMVAPMLSTMEASRLEAVAAYQKRLFTCGPVAVIGIGATGWATWSTPFFTGITLVVAFALGFGAWFWVTRPKKQFVDQQRQAVLDAVCAHVGDLTYSYAVGSTDFSIDVYRTAKIIPSYSTSSLEDLIKGRYRGCNFALVEAELTRKTGKSSTTVFQGLLLEISLPQAVRVRSASCATRAAGERLRNPSPAGSCQAIP